MQLTKNENQIKNSKHIKKHNIIHKIIYDHFVFVLVFERPV